MGFIKKLFENNTTVIGLCDLKKKQQISKTYETKSYVLNTLFTEPIENNFLLKNI